MTTTTTTTNATTWDEPAGCSSPRGWLLIGADCVGFYLDYGPGHYRSPHSQTLNTINGPIVRVWCQPGSECRECQPGNVLAVRYPGGPGTRTASRYFEAVADARRWVEAGTAEANAHLWQVVAAGVALAKFTSEAEARMFADETRIPGLSAEVVQAY